MLYTITYSRSGALRGLAGGQAPERYALDKKTGSEVPTGRYNAATLPGTFKIYHPARRLLNGEYMVNGTQEQVNKLVKEMQLITESGEPITEAPLRAAGAPFWASSAAYMRLESGTATLDDEDPRHKLMLMFMEADPRCQVFGENTNPALSGIAQYIIKKFGDEQRVESERIDKELDAISILKDLSFERQRQILSAFGVVLTSPEPKMVRDLLYKRISEDKDKPYNNMRGGEPNIDAFLRLAQEKSASLNIRDVFTRAYKEKGIISKRNSGDYVYGEFILGRSIDLAVEKLGSTDAAEILAQLIKDVNT